MADSKVGAKHGPIFVVGTPRSGTTLTARILGRHSRIFMPGETHFFDDIYANRKQLGDPQEPDARRRILQRLCTLYGRYNEPADQLRIDKLFRESHVLEAFEVCTSYQEILSHFMGVQTRAEGKKRWGNNTPRDLFNVNDVLSFYPDACFVICVRDIRDFLVSYKDKWKITAPEQVERLRMLYHPVVTSMLWKSSVRKIAAIRAKLLDANLIIIRYEKLVTEPGKTVESVCQMIGEKFEPDMLNVDTHNSSEGMSGRGIFSSSVGRWRKSLSAEEVWIAQVLAKQEMIGLEYPIEPIQPNLLKLITTIAVTPIALWRAIRANTGTRGRLLPYLFRRAAALLPSVNR